MSRRRKQGIAVGLFLLLALFLVSTFRTAVVHGDSMLPAYRNGEVVLVNRRLSLSGPLRKGDVVLVRNGNDILIKRVAYLAGDTIRPRDSFRFRRVLQFFELVPSTPETPEPGAALENLYRVPQGFVVVLGDNPSVSDDSRAFGPVPIEDLLGRVVYGRPLS